MSEALIFALTNPQCRLFIKMKLRTWGRTWWEHVVYTNCSLSLFCHSEQLMYITCSTQIPPMFYPCSPPCSPHVLSLELSISIELVNVLSYCGLVNARISTLYFWKKSNCTEAMYSIIQYTDDAGSLFVQFQIRSTWAKKE